VGRRNKTFKIVPENRKTQNAKVYKRFIHRNTQSLEQREKFEGGCVVKTVKVSEVSHGRLLRVVGVLQTAEGKRKTVEDALVFLLDEHDRNREPKAKEKKKH